MASKSKSQQQLDVEKLRFMPHRITMAVSYNMTRSEVGVLIMHCKPIDPSSAAARACPALQSLFAAAEV